MVNAQPIYPSSGHCESIPKEFAARKQASNPYEATIRNVLPLRDPKKTYI